MFAALTLAALVASPAFAASKHRQHTDMGSMASEMDQNAYNPNGATSTDPDPFIRRSLLIEGDHNTGE